MFFEIAGFLIVKAFSDQCQDLCSAAVFAHFQRCKNIQLLLIFTLPSPNFPFEPDRKNYGHSWLPTCLLRPVILRSSFFPFLIEVFSHRRSNRSFCCRCLCRIFANGTALCSLWRGGVFLPTRGTALCALQDALLSARGRCEKETGPSASHAAEPSPVPGS